MKQGCQPFNHGLEHAESNKDCDLCSSDCNNTCEVLRNGEQNVVVYFKCLSSNLSSDSCVMSDAEFQSSCLFILSFV